MVFPMSEQQRQCDPFSSGTAQGGGPQWLGQALTALALTLALATYLHATRSAVATAPHAETANLVSTASINP